MVSVILPSRNERFLPQTLADVLAKARGPLEVIVVLDGYWPVPPLPTDPRLVILHHSPAQGMRPAINAAARIARGQWLMKLDAHCLVGEGFDEILTAECDQDWVVVPRRYSLDPEAWAIRPEKAPIDAHYLSYPYERPGDPSCGLHGTVWRDRTQARAEVLLDDEMSSQGSCWFMSRAQWGRIGPLDAMNYGNFIQEFQEIGLKTWLGGGRVKVNKRTFYAHLHKGRKYGRGYSMEGLNHEAGRDFCTDYWMHDRWPERVHNLRWLIETFWPVPTWPADLDEAFRPRRLTGVTTTPQRHLKTAPDWTPVAPVAPAAVQPTRPYLASTRDGRKAFAYCTHLPALLHALLESGEGDVVELGTGPVSTPVMHWLCRLQGRTLVSYEHDPHHYALAREYAAPWHRVEFVEDWAAIDLERPWAVALVDHGPANRRKEELKRLAPWATYVVVHDTCGREEHVYHYREAYPLYAYAYQFTEVRPRTSILSNTVDVRGWVL